MNDIVVAARGYLGTPYQHQGRIPGKALDCIGVLVCAAWDTGKLPRSFDVTGYGPVPDGHLLVHHLGEQLTPIPQAEMAPGDALCVALGRYPQHVGILGDYRHGGFSIIHAVGPLSKVVEHRLLFSDRMRFVGAYRFKG